MSAVEHMVKKELYEMGISSEVLDRIMVLVDMKLNPVLDIKIKRSEDAKMFDLPKPKKKGDVGFDLPAVLPYKQQFECPVAREEYRAKLLNMGMNNIEIERSMRQVIIIKPFTKCNIPTGLSIELPEGYWSAVEARSSTSEAMAIVPKGVIDGEYRGEFYAVLFNLSDKDIEVRHGDRFAQFIVGKNYTNKCNVIEADELSVTERGTSGFGSTGQHETKIG